MNKENIFPNIKSGKVIRVETFIEIIFSGIVGTAVMTFFIHQISRKLNSKMKVVQVLGTMLTNETSPEGELSDTPEVFIAGNTAHYSVGIGFALSYLALWKNNYLKPNFLNSIHLGVVSGLFGIFIWKKFFQIHPHPPNTPLQKYRLLLFIAHIIFALGTTYTFKLLKGTKSINNIQY